MTQTIATVRVGDRVDGRDGPMGTVTGTREATAEDPAYVLVRLSRLFGLVRTTRLVPAAWMRDAPTDAPRVTLDASRAEVAGCPPLGAKDKRHAETRWEHGRAPAALGIAGRGGGTESGTKARW